MWEKNENKQKEARFGPFLIKKNMRIFTRAKSAWKLLTKLTSNKLCRSRSGSKKIRQTKTVLLFHLWQELWHDGRRFRRQLLLLLQIRNRTLRHGPVVIRRSGFRCNVAVRGRSVLSRRKWRNFGRLDRKHRRVRPGSGPKKPDRFVRARFRILGLEFCPTVCNGTCN